MQYDISIIICSGFWACIIYSTMQFNIATPAQCKNWVALLEQLRVKVPCSLTPQQWLIQGRHNTFPISVPKPIKIRMTWNIFEHFSYYHCTSDLCFSFFPPLFAPTKMQQMRSDQYCFAPIDTPFTITAEADYNPTDTHDSTFTTSCISFVGLETVV